MPIDLDASDPIFSSGKRPYARVEELVTHARDHLGVSTDRPWRIIASRTKLRKILFEVDDGGQRIIGKVSKPQTMQRTYTNMRLLWDYGMRPPAEFVIAEPIAWLPERSLLLQSKATGVQLLQLIRDRDPRATEGAVRAGAWLRSLQGAQIELPAGESYISHVERALRELPNALPGYGERIEDACELLLGGLREQVRTVPSHGDFHPMNVYVADTGRVTAIDLDTVAAREPAVDIAYFVAQTAVMGYHVFGDFKSTAAIRKAFLGSAPGTDPGRAALHVRVSFLRALHYDLCILKVKEHGHVETFVRAAEEGLEE